MSTSETKLYYIPYDVLRKNKEIPKSFFGFWWWLLRSIGKGLIRNFPKNFIIPILLMLTYILVNVVYMGIVNDTMYFDHIDKSILAYIFSGYAVVGDATKGFDYFRDQSYVKSIYWTIPMLFLLTGLIRNLFTRIRQGGFKRFIQDINGAKQTAKLYAKASTKSINAHILLGCVWASIIGLMIQSPISLFLLPIILFLSFTLRENSKIIGLISMFHISINIKRKKPKYVNIANLALGVYGLAIGFAFYFLVSMILWFTLKYNIFARIIFTIIIAITSFLLYKTRSKRSLSSTASLMMVMIGVFAIFTLTNFTVYADDGGWSESGRNLVGWLSNPGTTLLAALGLEGSVGTALGWLANTALGGILPALGLGEAMTVAQVLCGAGSPTDLGFAALGTALAPLGPLGSAIGDAWKGSIDALGGSEGGPTSGNSSGNNNSGSNTGSSSGSSGYGTSGSSGSSGTSGSTTSGSTGTGADSGTSGSTASGSTGTGADSGSSGSTASGSTGTGADSGTSGSTVSGSTGIGTDSGSSGSTTSGSTGADSGTSGSTTSGSTGTDSGTSGSTTSGNTEAESESGSSSSTTGGTTGTEAESSSSGKSTGYGYPRGNANDESWQDYLEELDEEEKKKLLGGVESPGENKND